jgi:hypothetical protein
MRWAPMLWTWDEQVVFALGASVLHADADAEAEVSIHVLAIALECTMMSSRSARRSAHVKERLALAREHRVIATLGASL